MNREGPGSSVGPSQVSSRSYKGTYFYPKGESQINVWIFLVFLEVESLDDEAIPFLIFWGISTVFSIVVAPACISHQPWTSVPLSAHLPNTYCLLIYGWLPLWQVWANISLQCWFAFLWWLVMLRKCSYVYWPSVCLLRSVCSGLLPTFFFNLLNLLGWHWLIKLYRF